MLIGKNKHQTRLQREKIKRELGLCMVDACKAIPEPGRKRCLLCAVKRNKYNSLAYSLNKKNDLCGKIGCKNLIDHNLGKIYCTNHFKQKSKYNAEYRANRKKLYARLENS